MTLQLKDNYIVGVVSFCREVREKLRHKANVWGMYVVSELRQSGVGRLLLTSLINKAKSLDGLEQLNLSVVSSNIQAKGLYSSIGFTTYGIEKNALKNGDKYFDEELMMIFVKNK